VLNSLPGDGGIIADAAAGSVTFTPYNALTLVFAVVALL